MAAPHVRALVRTSNASLEPQAMQHRAGMFSAAIRQLRASTLLVHRTDRGLFGYLIAEGKDHDVQQAALHLAFAVGAEVKVVDDFDEVLDDVDLNQPVGWARYEHGSSPARDSLLGANPTDTAKLLANSVPVGGWVAILMRSPWKRERNRHREWVAARTGGGGQSVAGSHHSLSPDAFIVSIWASAPDSSTTRLLLRETVAAFPAFDLSVKTRVRTRHGTAHPALAGAVTLTALAAASRMTVGLSFIEPASSTLLMLAGVLVVVGALRFAKVIPSRWSRMARAARTLDFPRPRQRLVRGKRPKTTKDEDGFSKTDAGDYPLRSDCFLVSPVVVVGAVAPTAGAASGETTTTSSGVPSKVLDRIGPMIGMTSAGPAHLSSADAFGGTAIIGRAGSGKSKLALALYAHTCLERVRPSGAPGFPGQRNTVIAFENKGEGIADYEAWAASVGDSIIPVDLADDTTYAIDLFHLPGESARARADLFVSAMTYAFDAGDIQGRSRALLIAAFTGALVLTPEMKAKVANLDPNESPVYYAYVLLAGLGDNLGVALAHEIMGAANAQAAAVGFSGAAVDPDLREAAELLTPLYQGRTETNRRSETDAPRNKIQELLNVRGWWHPNRPKLNFDDVIGNHWAVVINTGTSRSGRIVAGKPQQIMSSLMMFYLQQTIQRLCNGWQAQGRFVSIYADELALLAGSSPDVITWLKDQGRSFGVRAVLATQRPDQLDDRVRTSFINFSTLITFSQESVKTASQVADELGGGSDEWSAGHILNLEPFTAIVRSMVGQRRQEPYVVRVTNFEADRDTFPALQGYGPTVAARNDDTGFRDPGAYAADDQTASGTHGIAAYMPSQETPMTDDSALAVPDYVPPTFTPETFNPYAADDAELDAPMTSPQEIASPAPWSDPAPGHDPFAAQSSEPATFGHQQHVEPSAGPAMQQPYSQPVIEQMHVPPTATPPTTQPSAPAPVDPYAADDTILDDLWDDQ